MLQLTTPALLFPAISLLFLAYNNRFLALASLVRNLEGAYAVERQSHLYDQIRNLRMRLHLIRLMEFLGVLAFVFCVLSMFLLFSELGRVATGAFAVALLLLLSSLICALAEIHVSSRALEILLRRVEAPARDEGPSRNETL